MQIHDLFMRRCFDLAHRGASFVISNCVTGAIIVGEGRIIGEGYSPNPKSIDAEIQAIQSVCQENTHLLKTSTLYTSHEPRGSVDERSAAVHQIVMKGIPQVVVSVNSIARKLEGVHALRAAGVDVQTGVLAAEGIALCRAQKIVENLRRPYVILKYARSADGFLGLAGQQVWLSHPWLKRLTHKWRSEVQAIMVGTNTAETDNPHLNTRMYYGPSPLRLVLDRRGRLASDLNLFDGKHPTWVIQEPDISPTQHPNTRTLQLKFDQKLLPNILKRLYEADINSLIVEGGAQLINSFLAAELWDEARVYTSEHTLLQGIKAPVLQQAPVNTWKIKDTRLHQYLRTKAIIQPS